MPEVKVIAYIENDFTEKFGIPRQSGLADAESKIIFLPKYRNPDALRGIEGFSHLWILWQFSQAIRKDWSPTVRPPRLGGNTRMGVFATRSPFRPNSIGLSSVRLLRKESSSEDGTYLVISGADLMNGTPIYDIKPYLAYTDSHPEALGGFAEDAPCDRLKVVFQGDLERQITEKKKAELIQILSQDPRPRYQHSPDRVYAMAYGRKDVLFTISDGVVTVTEIRNKS
jgi:tRNA-Thr(GGU) m(6)t(6)A37 methyltransferase TsaA